jgi:hypothetical protein
MRRLLELVIFLAPCAFPAADPQLVVDRGLPKANLNNQAGIESRSNVRWTLYEEGFVGDDIVIGQPGENWIVDRIRVWTVPGGDDIGDPDYLSDFYEDVRLYFGHERGGISPVATGRFVANSNRTDNPNITITEAAEEPAHLYDDFGRMVRVWQIDFDNLSLPIKGGETHLFSAYGLGRPLPGEPDRTYPWFNHASNPRLGDARADGADDQLRLFKASGKADGLFLSEGKGWNKSCDINVLVFAHPAPSEPRP